jgi:hypothetical protein
MDLDQAYTETKARLLGSLGPADAPEWSTRVPATPA